MRQFVKILTPYWTKVLWPPVILIPYLTANVFQIQLRSLQGEDTVLNGLLKTTFNTLCAHFGGLV